eukprot:symbB.v1.2.016447.t2/scaffold1248.1/size129000/11
MAMLWVDKHRPKVLGELDYHGDLSERLGRIARSGEMPHILMCGPNGAGKSTRVHALLREIYGSGVETVKVETKSVAPNPSNPSNTVDIQVVTSNHHLQVTPSDLGRKDRAVVMQLIKEVASHPPLGGHSFKVVVIEEAGALSNEAQAALRRTMERYMKTCRIILLSDSASKIIPPLRSRCLPIRVAAPNLEDVASVLTKVSVAEGLKLASGLSHKIAERSGRNMRRAILILEMLHTQANASSLSKDPSEGTKGLSGNMAGYTDLTTVTQRKMELIVDLEKPIGPESPLFAVLLKPRPEPLKPEASKPVPFKQPTKLSPKEQEELREAYWRHVASPVQKFGGDGRHELPESITSIIPGRAWVVSHLLSEEECAEVIKAGEIFGLLPAAREAGTQGLRTNKRTGNYCSVDLSTLVGPRLPPALLDFIEESKPHTAVRGIHPNWRIARYDNEEFFAAHYDQADSLTLRTEDGSKERYDSSHTLLISLSDRSAFQGGATRFWPTATYDDTAIDVELPCGWAVIFEQKLLHAGLPVQGVKHIAQAGILRGMPSGVGHRPSTFRLGPGLTFT